jgi:predicted transcriptional regulator
MYVDILTVLAHRGPLKLTHVMYKANVNCSVLKEYLDFLLKQGLVEERNVGKRRVVFAVTQRGITVLKYFKELKEVLPIVEEAPKPSSGSLLNPILKPNLFINLTLAFIAYVFSNKYFRIARLNKVYALTCTTEQT